MSMFAPDIAGKFTARELKIVNRPINGPGGAQGAMRRVKASMKTDGRFIFSDELLQTCYGYAWDYGNGGYEDRFRAVIAAATRGGWIAPKGNHNG